MDTSNEPTLVAEDTVLAYVHAKRKIIVDSLMKDNKLPEDIAETRILLQALGDMDRAALGRKRIQSEEKTAASATAVAALIAKVLVNPSVAAAHKTTEIVPREAPKLSSNVPKPDLVEGETNILTDNRTYDSFMAEIKSAE